MKIEKKYIIEISNWSHPDFGVFAKFLNGLGGEDKTYFEISQPIQCYLCDVCAKPLWMKGSPCLYCLGLVDGGKNNPLKGHEHIWTAEGNIQCIRCGIYQKFLTPSEET